MLDRPSSVVKAPEDEPVSATSSTVGETETVELGPREWRKWVAFASAILNWWVFLFTPLFTAFFYSVGGVGMED